MNLGTKTLGPNAIAAFEDTIRIDKPQLWSPQSPNLYDVSFTVRDGDRKVAGYSLHSGIRSIKVSNGRLVLNGQLLNTRGVGLHEDAKAHGLRDRQRPPRPAASRRPRSLARRRSAPTTRCTRTRTSSRTGSAC